jgi:hypothetical protein
MGQQRKVRLYEKTNDVVRIDMVQEADPHLAVALMSFFRRIGASHVYAERVAPTLEGGDSTLFAAVRDRPWPPWGLGGRTVCGVCQVHPVTSDGVALSPIYIADEDTSNIGLMAAIYAEVLEELTRQEDMEVNYLVLEGSILADRVLRDATFEPSDDLVVTGDARYAFYRARASELRRYLKLDAVSVPELLAHELENETFDRHARFFPVLQLACQPTRFTDRVVREIAWIDGGLFDASLPGGVPPTPPSALPPEVIEGLDVEPEQ